MKKILSLSVSLCVIFSLMITVFALAPRIVDNAGVMSNTAKIQQKAERLSEQHQIDLVVVTEEEIQGNIMTYSEDYMIYYDYGFNSSKDCILLMFDIADREYWISTHGKAINIFTDYGIDYLGEKMISYLKNDDYNGAVDSFLDECEYLIEYYNDGESFDVGSDDGFSTTTIIIISLVVALIIASLVIFILKAQLNTAVPQKSAGNYLSNFNIRRSQDIYLYSNTTRTKIETKSSSGGSSTHSGSNGSSFGGGGGRY